MKPVADPPRIAACQCGALSARCSGEPWRLSLCHCLACKARSGSDFLVNHTFHEEQVELTGEASRFERSGDEGHWVHQYFCATCGTTLYHRIERRPGAITIAAGCFGTADLPPPQVEVYRERMMRGLGLSITPPPAQE